MKLLPVFVLMLLSMPFIHVEAKNKNEINLTIYFTNDTNGHPLEFTYMEDDDQGGLPARASLIKDLMKENKGSEFLILDSGGILMGRPESNLYGGVTDIAGMNSIGYYASGVGLSELWMTRKGFQSLNDKADFYFLCSNVTDQKNKEFCDKYSIAKIGGYNGIRVGLFSVISDEVGKELPEETAKEYKFQDPIETSKLMVSTLRSSKYKADIVIALTYLGYYADDSRIGSRTLASSVEDIDIIIDGRTGLKLEEPVTINNTRICQAFKWGLFLGEIKLKIIDNKIDDFQYKLYPVNYKENGKLMGNQIEEDKRTLNAIKNKMFNYDALIKKKICTLEEGKFDAKMSRYEETEIGDLICDAMLDFTKADIAFQNAGGLGEGIVDSKEINRTSFDKIIKYDNSVVVLDLTGEEILKILEYSMSNPGKGSFLQVGGIKFTYSKSQKKITEAAINGNDLNPSNFYKAAINSWLAGGGDGYKIFTGIPGRTNLDILHREVLYDYLEKIKDIKPYLDGRITIIN